MPSKPTPAERRKLVELKPLIAKNFTTAHWRELALLTGGEEHINGHPRLLRALHFEDDDYEPLILPTLIKLVEEDPENLGVIQQYLVDQFGEAGEDGENVSTARSKGRRIVFSPNVFEVPDTEVEPRLVAVMMPFRAEFEPVYAAIKAACADVGVSCLRGDDIWEHTTVIQDVFSLIFRASVVVCDFTGRNPNVFYETGIAHTLGKHVIPLSQSAGDVPFDVSHHRYLRYLNNGEGLLKLREALSDRLLTLVGF